MSWLELSRERNKKIEGKQLLFIDIIHKSYIAHPSEQKFAILTLAIVAEETRIGLVLCGHVLI